MGVVVLAAAWGLGEVADYPKSLNLGVREAPLFYFTYFFSVLIGNVCAVGLPPENLVQLNVAIEVLNAILLLPVLGFLFALSVTALPEEQRLQGAAAWFYGCVFAFVVLLCWLSVIASL